MKQQEVGNYLMGHPIQLAVHQDKINQSVCRYSPQRRRRSSASGRTAGRTGCCRPRRAATPPSAAPAPQSGEGGGIHILRPYLKEGVKKSSNFADFSVKIYQKKCWDTEILWTSYMYRPLASALGSSGNLPPIRLRGGMGSTGRGSPGQKKVGRSHTISWKVILKEEITQPEMIQGLGHSNWTPPCSPLSRLPFN